MSFQDSDLNREEYNTQLLEEIRDILWLLSMMYEEVNETGLELDDAGE